MLTNTQLESKIFVGFCAINYSLETQNLHDSYIQYYQTVWYYCIYYELLSICCACWYCLYNPHKNSQAIRKVPPLKAWVKKVVESKVAAKKYHILLRFNLSYSLAVFTWILLPLRPHTASFYLSVRVIIHIFTFVFDDRNHICLQMLIIVEIIYNLIPAA